MPYTSCMNRAFQILVTLAWGLWFGGLVMLFISVTSLFHTFADQRDVAATAASGLFHSFDSYRLIVAAAALVATFVWRVAGGASRLKTAVFTLFALAVIAATCSAVLITPKIERLAAAGRTNSPDFRRLHGASMGVYLVETLFVAGAGMLLPWGTQANRDTYSTSSGRA
jgi:hypothetical protein